MRAGKAGYIKRVKAFLAGRPAALRPFHQGLQQFARERTQRLEPDVCMTCLLLVLPVGSLPPVSPFSSDCVTPKAACNLALCPPLAKRVSVRLIAQNLANENAGFGSGSSEGVVVEVKVKVEVNADDKAASADYNNPTWFADIQLPVRTIYGETDPYWFANIELAPVTRGALFTYPGYSLHEK